MRTRTLISYISICLSLLLLFLLVAGAFWKSEHNPFQTPETIPFPSRTSELFSQRIEKIFAQSGMQECYSKTPMESISNGADIAWTQYEYSIRLERKAQLLRLIQSISAAIETGGGEIFQTYVDAENHQAVVVIGVDSVITHHLVFSWQPPPPVVVKATPTAQATPSKPETAPGLRVAIIIDDLGSSPSFVHRLLKLNEDLTYSILPHLEKSTEIATLLHEQQKEILLHLPMEPRNYPATSPGKGALLSHMTREQLQRTIDRDLKTVPFAAGVNNHMGSSLTASWGPMKAVLEHLRAHRLFFVDSRTTGATIGYSLAQQLGLKSAQRKVFLDVVPEVEAVKIQLQELAALAEQGKTAIAIGHPKAATLKALQEMLPEFKARNIRIVRVSEFTK